jgi:superfamily II DNA or RNA helicase
LRSILFRNADGKCQRCYEPLGDDWEADHIVPWSITHRTNVFEMQALCRACNQTKGAVVLRKPQAELAEILRDIRAGKGINRIVAHVTPGGGKSLFTPIAIGELVASGWADGVCTIVPRKSLRQQAAGDALKSPVPQLYGKIDLREITNEIDPLRGARGFVTTYQAVVAAQPTAQSTVLPDLFRSRRMILILDEPHHLEEKSVWHGAIAPLYDLAVLRVLMSGTLERSNNRRIAFLDYEAMATPDGTGMVPVLRTSLSTAVITYTRRQALADRVIIPIHFTLVDGRGEWVDRAGQRQAVESFDEAGDVASDALYVALRSDFAFDLLRKCYDDWRAYRLLNPRSKMLVVAPNIRLAHDFLERLKTWGEASVEIATSDDGPEAQKAIARFKKTDGDLLRVLVTVAMAYEGLDVPQITHLACLTHIRSKPWIEQMLNRATRFDDGAGAYEEQAARVWGPDDIELRSVMEAIRTDQLNVVHDEDDGQPDQRPGVGDGDGRLPNDGQVSVTDGNATWERVTDMLGQVNLSREETAAIIEGMQELGISGVSPIAMKAMFDRFGLAVRAEPLAPKARPGVTIKQRETKLRQDIQRHCNVYEGAFGLDHGWLNKRVMAHFGKPRPQMSVTQLEEVWGWLQREYPLPTKP